ncbi:MAG: cell division protein SepF [Bacteroides sp.]|nr:cell division protein SepF [Bacteroides sp.]MCM1549344.1 cell division protein SepF [Clostridium sp.]
MGKGIDKFMNILSLNDPDDDDYDNDDLFDDEIDLVEPKPTRQPKPKKEKPAPARPQPSYNAPSKAQAAASYNEDEDDYDYVPSYAKKPRAARSSSGSNNKVVSMNGRGSEVYVIKPQEFNEAQTVTDFLKDGKTIVINMEGIELNAAQRIIDFIGGACYALDGSLQAISSNIFIAAPQDIEVSGDLRDEILNESTVSPYLGSY